MSNSGNFLDTAEFTPYQVKSGEEYMNDAQRQHFENLLLSWKQQLLEEAERTLEHLKNEASENLPDPNDLATRAEGFNLELKTRERERNLLAKIDEALERIERHEYGFCESCGVDIGIRRLEARPTATLCIECKELDEIREKHRAN